MRKPNWFLVGWVLGWLSSLLLVWFMLPAHAQWQDARMNPYIAGAGAVASSCDSCTGGLILAHHFENIDCGVGTPCGCSTNATKTITLGDGASISADTATNWPSDGSNSLKLAAAITTIPVTWDKTKGTISFDVYCSTLTNSIRVILIGDAGGDYLKVTLVGSDDNNKVEALIYSDYTYLTGVTSGNQAFTGPKSSITYKWDTTTAHDGQYHSLTVNGNTTTSASQPTAPTGSYTTAQTRNENSSVCYIDNLKWYSTWQ